MALKIIILQYLARARFLKSFNLKDAFLISVQSRQSYFSLDSQPEILILNWLTYMQ